MNKCEAEFEKWYAPYRVSNRTFEKNDGGNYKHEDTYWAYEIFKAGWMAQCKTTKKI